MPWPWEMPGGLATTRCAVQRPRPVPAPAASPACREAPAAAPAAASSTTSQGASSIQYNEGYYDPLRRQPADPGVMGEGRGGHVPHGHMPGSASMGFALGQRLKGLKGAGGCWCPASHALRPASPPNPHPCEPYCAACRVLISKWWKRWSRSGRLCMRPPTAASPPYSPAPEPPGSWGSTSTRRWSSTRRSPCRRRGRQSAASASWHGAM